MDLTKQQQLRTIILNISETVPQLEDRFKYLGYNSGMMGLVIFYCYLARYTDNSSYLKKAEHILYKAIDNINPLAHKGFASIFFRELVDIGITIHYLNFNGLLKVEANDFLEQLDDILYGFMIRKISEGDLNVFTGALAAGHYFLTRIRVLPGTRFYLEELVNGIEENALQDESGNYYWKWPYFKSEGVYLGLSCGSAMMLTFLAALYENDISPNKVANIVKRASAYIIYHKRKFNKSCFPILVGEKVTVRSLLHGDLGTCYGLLRAANVLTSQELEQETLNILYNCCKRREKEDTLIDDASVFYGASGVALLFGKIYRITNCYTFHETATYWHKKIISFRQYENEFSGFRARFNQKYPHTNAGFSEGIIGIGMVLMKHLDKDLPSLDPLVGLL